MTTDKQRSIILIELEPLGDDAGNRSCSIDELRALLRDEIDTKPEGDTQS